MRCLRPDLSEDGLGCVAGSSGRNARRDQCIRRVPCHTAHAGNVQKKEKKEAGKMSANTVALAYLIASVFFILALKGLSSPLTARRGNLVRHGGNGDCRRHRAR